MVGRNALASLTGPHGFATSWDWCVSLADPSVDLHAMVFRDADQVVQHLVSLIEAACKGQQPTAAS